jgi:hypothetical protein
MGIDILYSVDIGGRSHQYFVLLLACGVGALVWFVCIDPAAPTTWRLDAAMV